MQDWAVLFHTIDAGPMPSPEHLLVYTVLICTQKNTILYNTVKHFVQQMFIGNADVEQDVNMK